jgi:cytochrome P450
VSQSVAESASQFYFNPFDPAFRANPYPHYKPLLAGPPKMLSGSMRLALIARYDDVIATLRDHDRFSSHGPQVPGTERIDVFGGARTMLFSDPPIHSRLRRLVTRDFTPRRIRELEPGIREIATQLIDKAVSKGEFEAMRDLANPLPVMVISQMLGVPAADYEKFKHWSDEVISAGNTLPGTPFPESAVAARNALREYFSIEIAKRRAGPGPDLVSALIAAHEDAEALSADELLAFVLLLLLAGNETTTNLIGNGLLALGRNLDQMENLRANPSLMPAAIDEMLRYDGPVQATGRFTKAAVNVGGTDIPEGSLAFLILAAANRDPSHYPNPEVFDISRDASDHIAFGEGIHFCLGSALARLEGAIAIGAALERFPRLRLADPSAEMKYKGSFTLRGLDSLRMAIH